MAESHLLHELVAVSAARSPDAPALTSGATTLPYALLLQQVQAFAAGLCALGLPRMARVGIWLDKRVETVVASFGAPAAGCVFVPMNPVLKPEQVVYIARDCQLRLIVTSRERLALLAPLLAACPDLRHVLLTSPVGAPGADPPVLPAGVSLLTWDALLSAGGTAANRVIDTDVCAILYTSGSTGQPKGVVLSHRNMVAGAKSVARTLDNGPQDVLLAALPLSFDAGFSQLTTAFYAGARVVLLNPLLPRDVLQAMVREKVTGLTAVPPLYQQLAPLVWPAEIGAHLRYFASTGGRMPRQTLDALRAQVPRAKPFLMYGLTEAFRSTCLPPEEVDRRPDSIGKAIPNAEVFVLREDGSECAPGEPGELVHRGALVGLGYWNDPQGTAERFRPLPAGVGGRDAGLPLPEFAVFSGDTVRRDDEGFLYFVGRRDDMIKTSGYRVSPNEVEEVLYASRLVGECVAFGVDHPQRGQAIQVIATPPPTAAALDSAAVLAECRRRLPAYMVPAGIDAATGPLPRIPNGKIDRRQLVSAWQDRAAPQGSAQAGET